MSMSLYEMQLAPATRLAYTRALNKFFAHARLTFDTFLELSAPQVDHLVARFIQHSYDTDSSFVYASHALNAVAFYRPDLRHCLYVARGTLRGWERNHKSQSHAPITWEMAVLLALSFAKTGHLGEAIALLLGFDCYLRVSEIASLQKTNIVMPRDARIGGPSPEMAVVLPRTKTGLNQSVTIARECVRSILCAWMQSPGLRSAPGSAFIFAFTPASLRMLMRDRSAALGLAPYVPHSLRHGGATHDFVVANKSVEHIQFRGRWKSLESTRRYVQTARALLAANAVPDELHAKALALVPHVADMVIHRIHVTAATAPPKRT